MNVLTNIPIPAAAAIAAVVPLAVGMVWYNPKVFGKAWMEANNFTEEGMKTGFNMPLVFGLTYVFGFFLSFALAFMTIHQYHMYSMMNHELNDPATAQSMGFWIRQTMSDYGSNFRTFKHGALHGTIGGVFVALPIIGINGLFERKGFKYIAIHAGFWIVCMAIMGGIMCHCCPRLM